MRRSVSETRSQDRPAKVAKKKSTPGGAELSFDREVAVAHLRAMDPAIVRLIDAVGPFTLEVETEASTFAALSRTIVYQQLNGRAAATIHGRVCAAATGDARGVPSAEDIMGLSDATLRGAGLSASKLLSLRDLASRTIAGRVPDLAQLRRLTDEAIIECLTEIRGIGPWSVQMLLMFRLGRPDVLPVDDFGVRKGFGRMLHKRVMPDRHQLERHARRWRPYRSVASWYMWRATELPAEVRLKK